MPHHDLSRYPAINGLYDSGDNATRYPASRLRFLAGSEYDLGSVGEVDAALAALLAAGLDLDDLAEQTHAIFGSEWNDWAKARTELRGLEYLNARGLLSACGWPENWRGDSPPFDAKLVHGTVPVVADFKPAMGNGLDLLLESIRPEVDAWAVQHRLPRAAVEAHYLGTVTQPRLGRARQELRREFADQLAHHRGFPGRPITLQARGTEIAVTVRAADGGTVSSGAVGVAQQVDDVVQVVERHINSKGRHLGRGDPCFLLIYVRPNGCGGSDISDYNLQLASQELMLRRGGHDKLLGILFFDWTGGQYRDEVLVPSIRSRFDVEVARNHDVDLRGLRTRLHAVEFP